MFCKSTIFYCQFIPSRCGAVKLGLLMGWSSTDFSYLFIAVGIAKLIMHLQGAAFNEGLVVPKKATLTN